MGKASSFGATGKRPAWGCGKQDVFTGLLRDILRAWLKFFLGVHGEVDNNNIVGKMLGVDVVLTIPSEGCRGRCMCRIRYLNVVLAGRSCSVYYAYMAQNCKRRTC